MLLYKAKKFMVLGPPLGLSIDGGTDACLMRGTSDFGMGGYSLSGEGECLYVDVVFSWDEQKMQRHNESLQSGPVP